jgi:prepilin-type N-terminal cleavage/methylation domain-containing protein
MKTNPGMQSGYRGFTLVELLVVIVIIAALAGLTAPMVIRQRKKADQTEAVNNARQIGIALFEFETEYGTFPDEETATAVAEQTGTTLVAGSSANDRFRQLIRAGIAQSEKMFYAKSAISKKPDGLFVQDADALEPGEVGFGIVVDSDGSGLSAAGNPARPICATPFTAALDGKFDFDFFDGKAVVLKLDNSVESLSIVKVDGRVLVNGEELIASGPNTVWGTNLTPTWAYPEPK